MPFFSAHTSACLYIAIRRQPRRRSSAAVASLAILLLPLLVPAAGFGQAAGRPAAAFGRLPLHFEANRGQAPPAVQFCARGPGYTLFLTPTEAVLALRQLRNAEWGMRNETPPSEIPQSAIRNQHSAVLRMQLVGAHPAPPVTGRDPLPGVVNYFPGNDPATWRTRIPTYARVHYQEVYPGVDLVYYGHQQALEYDFHLAPGADPAAIRLAFPGAETVTLNAQGDLVLTVPGGTVRLRQPHIYQEGRGGRHEITGGYVLYPKSKIQNPKSKIETVGFHVAAYDPTRPLVIDPVLSYSTYLGGSAFDEATALTVDGTGHAYVAGVTFSGNFPRTPGAYEPPFDSSSSAFVAKLTPDGTALVYATFFGGTGENRANAIAVDSAGSAYVAGITKSALFPTTTGAHDRGYTGGPGDAFVTKLTPDGSGLVYSTYLGGIGVDRANAIAVDATGHAYVAGETTSSASFPTTSGALDRTYNGNRDAFVVKLNPTGTDVVYGTYLGGTGEDRANAIAVDATGNAYVAGETASGDFRVTSLAFDQTHNGGSDAFVVQLNPTGTALIYGTFLGGGGNDRANAIAVDSTGHATVAGETASGDFPVTPGTIDPALAGNTDAFVAQLTPDGSLLVYATYLGGSGEDHATAIALDAAGSAYVAGSTASTDFPMTPDAYFPAFNGGSGDAFVAQLNAAGTVLVYATFLGGSDADGATGIALDLAGSIYVAGSTASTDFPVTPGVFTPGPPGGGNAFVVKIDGTRQPFNLSVAVTGFGAVTGFPPGITCPGDCGELYVIGTRVRLTAAPNLGWAFVGWGGDCTGTGECEVQMTADRSVTATFVALTPMLTVATSGSGTVTSEPAGINCGSDCAEAYAFSTGITLTAAAGAGLFFDHWEGDCAGTAPTCAFLMTQARNVTAVFSTTGTLSVALSGNGSGLVTSNPSGISCAPDCAESYSFGAPVILTATPGGDSSFDHWEGDCSGRTPTCTVLLTQARNVTAVFTLIPVLTVVLSGTGTGTVTSDPPGINCATIICTAAFPIVINPVDDKPIYTQVTLTATPNAGSYLNTWGGSCGGRTPTCTIRMDIPRGVAAVFSPNPTLTVTKGGLGSGTVTSDPPGINCGPDCTTAYPFDTQVTLTAVPSPDSLFDRWGGPCGGTTPTCTVAMDRIRAVTASFILTPSLTVIRSGTGTGSVTSDPAGIDCGATCSAAYAYGTFVTLTAVPSPDSAFDHWEGDCTGTTTTPVCTAVTTRDRTVTAFFRFESAPVTIQLNQPSFRAGEILRLSLTTNSGTAAIAVDVYVALGLPDGTLLFLQPGGGLMTSLTPIATGWTIAPFTGEIFEYTFSGGEPPGNYIWYVAFTLPGGNPMVGTVGSIVSAPFSFGP